MEQRSNDPLRDEEVPFRWRAFGALAGELAIAVAARRARTDEERLAPVAWAAE